MHWARYTFDEATPYSTPTLLHSNRPYLSCSLPSCLPLLTSKYCRERAVVLFIMIQDWTRTLHTCTPTSILDFISYSLPSLLIMIYFLFFFFFFFLKTIGDWTISFALRFFFVSYFSLFFAFNSLLLLSWSLLLLIPRHTLDRCRHCHSLTWIDKCAFLISANISRESEQETFTSPFLYFFFFAFIFFVASCRSIL